MAAERNMIPEQRGMRQPIKHEMVFSPCQGWVLSTGKIYVKEPPPGK